MLEVWYQFWEALLSAYLGFKGLMPGFLLGGFKGLEDYFFGKIFGAFVPAFFLAGAIGSWIPRSTVVRYLSAGAHRGVAYSVATIAGGLLSVCACGILPLFSSVYSRGAGIGPAMTFLFAGPAINLIAIFYTFDLLGWNLGVARVVSAIGLSILVGLIFEAIYQEEVPKAPAGARKPSLDLASGEGRATWQLVFPMFFMVVATVVLPLQDLGRFFPFLAPLGVSQGWFKFGVVVLSVLMVVSSTRAWFTEEERSTWLEKTWFLIKQIIPKVILGIFFTGLLEANIPRTAVIEYVGSQGLVANFFASLVGGILYFGTILGVVAANFFRNIGMPDGPVLALLLAGPTVTLPSVFAITEIIGWRRAAAYFSLVVVVSTIAGWTFSQLGLGLGLG